jgi:mono/diheme cytochrome c family protein
MNGIVALGRHCARSAVIAATSVAAMAGCAAAPHSRAAGSVTALSVRPVAWNPARAPVGRVRAVADAGNVVAVFGDSGATVLSSGAIVATDRRVTDWVDAATIRGADGSVRWIVGLDGHGHLYYLRGLTSFEDVSARYGLYGHPVRRAAMLDGQRVGFLLDHEIAVADGGRVTRFGPVMFDDFLGGGGLGVGVVKGAVVLVDTPSQTTRTYRMPGVTHVAIGPDGRLYVATSRAIYAMTPQGILGLLYDAGADAIHGLAVSGDRVWFADGAELGTIDGDAVAETAGARVALDATLASSPSGDVWVLAHGTLSRFAPSAPDGSIATPWSRTLAPIFARSCAACHVPNGIAGTDLSTPEAWQSEREAIRERVVVRGTMPPEGHALAEADRAAIKAWVEGR